MEGRQIPLVLAVAACVAMLVAVPALGVGVEAEQPTQVDNNTTSEENGTFGQQVAAFMQTSAVDANTTVESGMWNAGVNVSTAPEREVTNRTAQLERERQQLARQMARLEERRDRLPAVTYTAQASALRERLRSLQDRVNGTEQTAQRVGANTSGLERLRTQASNMTGPEVSAHARNVTDAPRGPPAGVPGGPPTEQGSTGPQTGPADNRTGSGPQGDPGPRDTASRNDTARGEERQQRMTGPESENRSSTGHHDPPGRTVDGTDGAPENETTDAAVENRSNSGPSTDRGQRTDREPRNNSSNAGVDTDSRETAESSVSTTSSQFGAVVW